MENKLSFRAWEIRYSHFWIRAFRAFKLEEIKLEKAVANLAKIQFLVKFNQPVGR